MNSKQQAVPLVMVFAGNDPTGGAGIQADIETLASMGCQAAPVITAVTVQNTHDVIEYSAMSATLVIEQARAVLEEMPPAAFKIGMIGTRENAEAIHTLLRDYPNIPVVLDPVLYAGGGHPLAESSLQDAMISLLLPLTTVLTPNTLEARMLAPGADTLEVCAQQLMDQGSEFVLVTGTHEDTPEVVNNLYGNRRLLESFTWERLPYNYHGSGCTLSSAIAGMLAHGLEPFTAVYEAQHYTWETLKYGYRIGKGEYLPNRLYWARNEEGQDT